MATDMMPQAVQKEMLEDQLQKLSLENCTLLLENKLIKDKYSRSVAQIAELESRLKDTQKELGNLQTKQEHETIHIKHTQQADVMREIELYKTKAATSAKAAEMLKSEISLLEEQFHNVKQENEIMRLSVDKSKLHDSHKQEVQSLQDELAHLKHLLVESEKAVQAESAKSKDCIGQLHKLTELQELLQLQIEEANCRSNALEKQMEALQMRLHVTEERLTQERADRAGNLSHIEEKLLTENAKLQTKAKELDRQLKREKEKARTLQQRASELREENLHLRLTLPDEETKDYSIPYDRRNSSRKQATDIKQIWKQLDSESSLPSNQEDMESLVLYLWDKCQNLQQQLKTWQLYLEQIEVPVEEDYFISLQNALAVKTEYEAKVQQTEEKLEDVSAEKITAEQAYKQQLTELVKEKHESFARVKTLENLMDALKTENEVLRHGLSKTPGHFVTAAREEEMIANGRVEILQLELAGLQSNISQLTRRNKVLETEVSTLQCQLSSRDKELAETFAELKTAQVAPKSNTADELFKQQKIESLTFEVASLNEEIHMQSEKHFSIQKEKEKLEAELSDMKDDLQSVRKRNKDQDLSESLTQKNQTEKMDLELEKKDEVILKLTTKLNENEISLSKTQSDLKLLQKIHTNMEAQLESIQYQLDQRCQLLDTLSAKENDQVEQLEMVKGMIYTLNQRLAQKQGELDSSQLQLQQAEAKIAKLNDQSATQIGVTESVTILGETTARSSQLGAELRLSEIKLEKEKLEAQLMQTTNTLASVQEDCETLNAEVSKIKKEASDAVASNAKMANEHAALEKRIQVLEEEKLTLEKERNTLKGNISRLEISLHEVISTFENESKCQLNLLCTQGIGDSESDLKPNADEPKTLRLLIFAKIKENEIIMEKVKCQEQELRNLEKVCQLFHRENEQMRADVSRVTNVLVVKMRETAATLDLNRVLLREQVSLQKQLVLAEKHLEQEKDRTEQRKADVNEIIKKIEHSEQVNLAISVTLQQKDSVISDQEVRLRQVNLDLSQAEAERDRLKAKVDELKESMRSLSNVNSGLENTIQARDAAIRDEQSVVSRQKEDILTLSHKAQVFEHEQALMLKNVSSEKKVQEKLQDNMKAQEECIQMLNKKIAELTQELELQKGYLVAAKETIQQTKVNKESIMKDYHDVCRRLGEKETILLDVQKEKNEEITQMKQEVLLQSQAVNVEKVNSERDLGQLKREIEDLKNQLQRKEGQVSSFGQTLKELEDAQRKITSLESYTTEQDKIATETKLLIESLRSELFSLRDQNSELHDTIARKEVVILDLKDQLRQSGQSSESQVVELRHTIEGMRSHYEFERKSMREGQKKVEESLKSSVQETLALRQAQDSLTEELQSQEKLLGEARHKLSQEEIARKFAEEKLIQHQEIMDELRKKKASLEETVNRLQLSLNKSEADHSVMQERARHLTSQLKNLEMVLKEREIQNESLKADVVRHQQMLETHRQQSASELHVFDLKLKQKVDSKEKDQMKLMHQAHQLSVDLEQAREIIVIKNKEHLKLQERVLELENHLREGETRLKHTENTLKQEEEMQTKMITRFQEQESELKKLRNFLAKKADEDGDGKGMWQEMNHVLSELSHQLQFHMETSRLLGQGGNDHAELVHRLRWSLLEAESRLNTERALHAVTRSSMQALEEDCTRLRQTILTMRRHGANKEKKQKSRMEEINEIIARSQTRAQALLASGEFSLDGSLRNLNPSRDYSVADTSFSPDTSFASDASFGAAHLANLSFLNLSGNLDNYSPRK